MCSLRPAPWEVGLLTAILVIGLLARLVYLHETPPGLYLDEAAYGLDGLAAAAGDWRAFYPRNNGREPLFIWLLAAAFSLFEATPYSIRLVAALSGAATVVTTWWMVRSLAAFSAVGAPMAPQALALWTALAVATSYWHISLSRLGFRAILLPLLLTITFALVWESWRRLQVNRQQSQSGAGRGWAVGAGVALGMTLYTYSAGRVAIVLLVTQAALLWWLAGDYDLRRRDLAWRVLLMVAVAALVAAPLLIFFMQNRQAFLEHAAYVSIFNERFSGGQPLQALAESSMRTLGMLTGLVSDPNLRHNPAQRPAIDPLLGGFLAIGAGVAFVHWRQALWHFGLLWIVVFLAPVVLSAEGTPHSLRAIALVPASALVIVLAIGWISRTLLGRWGAERSRRWAAWAPIPLLLFSGAVGIGAYFGAWQQTDRFRGPFFVDYVALAEALNRPDARDEMWILPLPPAEDLGDDRLTTVDFLLRNPKHVAVLRLGTPETFGQLSELVEEYGTLNVVTSYGVPILTDYDTRFSDPTGELEYALQLNRASTNTQDVQEGEIAGFPFRSYRLRSDPHFVLPALDPAAVAFGDAVKLTGVALGGAERGSLAQPIDTVVGVALEWEALDPLTTTLKASLVLRHEESGLVVAQQDRFLVGREFPRNPSWPAGATSSSYHWLTAAPGSPPGRYRLELGLYGSDTGLRVPALADGETSLAYPIAEVELGRPELPAAATQPAIHLDPPVELAGVLLTGVDVAPVLAPGERAVATLHLERSGMAQEAAPLLLSLQDADGRVAVEALYATGNGPYPPALWRQGERVLAYVPLRLPGDLATGTYALHVAAGGEPSTPVATIEVLGRSRITEAPPIGRPADVDFGGVVRLVGLAEEPSSAAPGKPFSLSFVWSPMDADERALVRFVHLVDSAGAIQAQVDSIPCAEGCPAAGWLAGEFLLDDVELDLPADLAPGDYSLLVGWYDLATFKRLAAAGPDGAALPDDAYRLALSVPAE